MAKKKMASVGTAQAQGVPKASPSLTGPKGAAAQTPSLNPKYASDLFTGRVVPNKNTTKKGFNSSIYPWAAEFYDPINDRVETIPLDSNGTPRWSPPVHAPAGPKPSKHAEMSDEHIASTPLGASMLAAGLDPRSMRDRYLFKAKYDPRTPSSVYRGLGGAPERGSLDDLDPRLADAWVNNQAQRDWQSATVKSANASGNRGRFAGPGISYNDPSIPPLRGEGSGYWQDLARQRHAAWAGGAGTLPPPGEPPPPPGGEPPPGGGTPPGDPYDPGFPIDDPGWGDPIPGGPGHGKRLPPIMPPPIGQRPPYTDWPPGVGDLGPGLGDFPWWLR